MGIPPANSRKRRTLLWGTLALAAVGAATFSVLSAQASVRQDGPVFRVEKGGVVYSFHAAWRTESLHSRPGKSVARNLEDPVLRDRMRSILLRKLKVKALEEIPQEGGREMESLRALGYI